MDKKKSSAIFPDVPDISTPKTDTNTITPSRKTRNDGWSNITKSFGTSRDARTHTSLEADYLLDKTYLGNLYMNDGLIRRIIDAVPEDMFREWGTVENDDTSEYSEGLIQYELARLKAPSVFTQAKKWARLMGGALIYIGATGSGDASTPLNFSKIKSIEFLKVYDLADIITWESTWDENPNSPTFGQISQYKVKIRIGNKYAEKVLHASRCIPVYGARIPPSSVIGNTLETRNWGITVLQSMYSDIRDYRTAFSNTSGILSEFVIGKYKFSDLDEMLATGNEQALQVRIQAIEMAKSYINAVMIGTDEDYLRDSASVAGLADLLDRFMMQVSAVSGIPVTRLFGRSASGLNATGEGDQKSYYDNLASQRNDVTPDIQKLIDMIATWKNMEGDHSWKWNSMYQLTSEQIANENRIIAETIRTRSDAAQRMLQEGVIMPDEARKIVFGDEVEEKDMAQLMAEVEELNESGIDESNQASEGEDDPSEEEENPDEEV